MTPPPERTALYRVVLDLADAAAVLGIGRTRAYELAKSGEFPCRVIPVGRRYRVPVFRLLDVPGASADGLRKHIIECRAA
jgi:hypothetical protein